MVKNAGLLIEYSEEQRYVLGPVSGTFFTGTSASLQPGVHKWVSVNQMLRATLRWLSILSDPGGIEILLVASRYRNRDKLLPDGTLSLYMQT